MKRSILILFASFLFIANTSLKAQSLYGSDATVFSWNTTATNKVWSLSTGGPYTASAWPAAGGYTAVFEGTAGTVTVNSAVTANGLTFSKSNYILSGSSTITLAGSTPTITTSTAGPTVNLNAPISCPSGSVMTITWTGATSNPIYNIGSGTNTIGGGINVVKAIVLDGNCAGGSAFGTSGNAGTITFQPAATGSSITNFNTAGANSNTVYNPIVLNSGGSLPYTISLGATKGGTGILYTIKYAGAISGASDVYLGNGFSGAGGAATTIFSNGSNTYSGKTIFNPSTAGYFQCGIANCFPQHTQFVFGEGTATGASPYGAVDLNGFSQTLGSLESNFNASLTGPQAITNSSTTAATITIGGGGTSNASATYAGIIGTETYCTGLTLAGGAGNDIAVTMNASGNTETFAGANTFTGALTLTAGTVVTGVANAFAATMPVVFNGGTLKSGTTTGNTQSVGTITLNNNSTLTLGTGSHSVTFSGLGTFASGKTLTITGWTGTAGGSGTGGKVFIGGTALTTAQLAQISFSGYTPGTAYQLGTGEIVPLSSTLTASLSPVSPATGSETAGTTFTITVTTSGNTSVSSTVAYAISGIQASQIASGSLTGLITIPSGSSTGSTTITVQNDNIYEGTETGTVSISLPTGSIATASSGTVTFTLTDDAIFYWNGGTTLPLTGPATGGTGTWSATNAWIAPVNTVSGTPETWADGYEAYLGGTAGTISLSTSPSPSSISVNTGGYIITPNSTTAETLSGTISIAASDNLTINDPAQSGTTNGRTLTYTGSGISGGSGSTLTIGGAQGASTTNYSYLQLQPSTSAGCTISVPVIMNGTGTGGYVSTTINAGIGTTATLSSGIQIASTNVATVVIGAKSGWTMTVNGITGGSGNTSPVLISNTPAGSGKGTFIFEGTSNYYGPTYLATNTGGIVQCSGANSLSPNSVLTFGSPSTAAQGPNLDLGGADQTIAGLASLTGATGEINNSGTSGIATLTINQSTNTTFGLRIIDSTTGGKTAVVKSGIGTLTITGLNTFTGGLTLTGGTLQEGAAGNLLANTLPITFNGGTFSTGATTGYTETVGAFNLSDNSTLALGTGSHSLTFSSLGTMSSGKILTISGWQGIAGSSGTAGQVFIGSSQILSAGQLAQITFSGHSAGAVQLSTGEIVPFLSSIEADLTPVSPGTGSEAAGTTYTITVNTTSAVSTASTVTYTITGIQASQLAAGSSLTGTIIIPAGSTSGSVTITVQTDNIIEGTETGVVSISSPTGDIGIANTSTVSFTLYDNVAFYWNGGTPTNNPATGGTGTWATANAWIAPVNDGTGASHTWIDGYPAYLAGSAGTISLSGAVNPTSISVNTGGYVLTPNSTTAETLSGTISIAAGDNFTINDPTQSGTTNGRTLTYTGSGISGGSGSTLTIGGAQGASTTSYSYLQLQPSTSAGCTISVPVIMNGTGTGGYVSTTIDAGTGTLATLSGGVQIASTNAATVVLGAKSGWNMIVNGITSPGGSSNTSPVLISNTPAGSGKGGFTFEGTSNYYGPTYLGNNAGTIVKCAAANTLSPNSVMTFGSPSTVGQGADLDLAGSDQTIGGLSSLTGATGEITNSAASGTNTLTVNQSTSTTFGLRMIDSTLGAKNALTKSGAGVLTMTGINTYTGATTVSGGSLFVNGSLAAGSAVNVSSGGTIGGSGTAAGTLSLSGTVSPGVGISPSAGNLTTGAQTWNDGALYKFDILNVSGTAGTSTTWDLLTSTAGVDVSTGNYTIDLTGNPTGFSTTSSYSWTFLTAASITGFSSSRFTILTTNFTAAFSGVFSISQVGNTLVIKYCPPATASNTGPYIPGQTISLTSGPSGQTSYAWTGPNSYTASTENPTRTSASSIMTGTYTVTVTGSNGCSDTANTFVSVNALGDYVWTGGAGTTVWTTPTNWSPTSPAGGPSGCSQNVIIPVSSIYPVITAATTIGNTTVHAGAQITLNAGLSVCGTLVGGISSPANFLGSSHLVMTGTGRQLDSGMINVNYLEINNTGSGVWSLGAVTVNNALIMTNGNFTDNTGGSVTLVSNASGDAYLDNFTSSTAGNYYFNLTVQRYISNTANGYRDLGAPVITNDNCLNNAYPITGQNDVECWYAYSPYPNLQVYDESLIIPSANGSVFGHWKSYTNLNTQLYPMTGYAFRTYVGSPYTISFTGPPNTGTYTASITHTTSAIPANDGWNFLSNPYPSPIKWSLVKAMNAAVANGEYYVYNTTGEYTGNWGTFNGTTGVNGAVDEIATSQGFFIQAPASTTFTMDNTVRTSNTSGQYFGASPLLDNEVRLVLTGGANSDEIVTYTDAQATNGYDPELDAVKMPAGSTVGISYSMPGHDYAINVMNTLDAQTVLPLSIWVADTGSYTLNATMLNIPGLTAYLRDAQSRQNISLTDLASGPVTLNLNGGQTYSGRFSVVFKSIPAVTTGITTTEQSATRIYSYGDKVYIERSNSDAASISVTNLLGQEVSSLNTNTAQTEFEMPTVQPWYAIVKVTEQNGKVTVAKVLINNNQ